MEVQDIANTKTAEEYLHLFLQSRQAMEVSPGTLSFYRVKLGRFLSELNADTAKRQDIEAFLLNFKNPGNRHAYYRAIKTFYNWRMETFRLPSPMQHMKAPKLSKLILPSRSREEVLTLIDCHLITGRWSLCCQANYGLLKLIVPNNKILCICISIRLDALYSLS